VSLYISVYLPELKDTHLSRIWEKKYGRNANHKKKEAESSEQGSQRRPPAHGTHASNRTFIKGSTRQPDGPQHRYQADKGWGQRAGAPHGSAPQKPAPPARSSAGGRVAEKPIHPSWEAKRKLKEKESATIVPSQGKKIKFS